MSRYRDVLDLNESSIVSGSLGLNYQILKQKILRREHIEKIGEESYGSYLDIINFRVS